MGRQPVTDGLHPEQGNFILLLLPGGACAFPISEKQVSN
jgi:hypothetical protein